MIKTSKTIFSVLFILFITLIFITSALLLDKKLPEKKAESNEDPEKKMIDSVISDVSSYKKSNDDFDGVDSVYEVTLKNKKSVCLMTSTFKGFSTTSKIAVCFDGDELLFVKKLSSNGIPSFYDDRVLSEDHLDGFKGELDLDNEMNDPDKRFIEIDPVSEFDVSDNALIKSVDDCCKAYYTIKTKENGGE